jgi:cyanophycinase-like exopeptidase
MNSKHDFIPGPIAFFGSGETAPSGQKIFDFIFNISPDSPLVKIIETPAGFEPNSDQVAGNVAEFIRHHLQNYNPDIEVIPARKKGSNFSPDNPEIAFPILEADLLFMGPGSPSYAVRQLADSVTWEYLLTRHQQGAALALSSATTIAVSSSSLPVYEIYKVGMDLHWIPGLDLFGTFQLPLVFIPHWNNTDGGRDLDTSHCYMGQERFNILRKMLPEDQIIIGIDEHTGLIFDFESCSMTVIGLGNVTILRLNESQVISSGSSLDLNELGEFDLSDPLKFISQETWDRALKIQESKSAAPVPSDAVIQLAEERKAAREDRNWEEADILRQKIEELGWEIKDREHSYQLDKKT